MSEIVADLTNFLSQVQTKAATHQSNLDAATATVAAETPVVAEYNDEMAAIQALIDKYSAMTPAPA